MNRTLVSTKPPTRRRVALASPQAQEFLNLSTKRGWDFLVLGQAPYLDQPMRLGDWQIVPVQQDTSHIPAHTLERVQAIYEAGLRPRGFVLVHEAPRLLAAPPQNQLSPQGQNKSWARAEFSTLLTSSLARDVALGLTTIVVVTIATLFATAVVAAAAIDPILVAITEDNYWVEVDRWWV